VENANNILWWIVPILGASIWLQRGASFMIPKRHLERPFLKSLNRLAPMGIIFLLVLIGLDTGLSGGWLGIALEVAILLALGVLYLTTGQVFLTILSAAAIHWTLSAVL